MSEVLNEKVDGSEAGGFSRRRVVKGVAWSVPVLVTAVAVPPASASPGTTPPPTFSMSLGAVSPQLSISRQGSSGVGIARTGDGPTKLLVQNAPGPVSGSIIITANGAVDGRTWIGVKTLGASNATLGPTTFGAARTSTTTYTLTGSPAAECPITFLYLDDSKPGPAAGQQTFTVTVTVNGSAVHADYPDLRMTIT